MKTSCRSSALLRKGGDYLNVTINRAEMLSAIKRASAIAPADSPLDVLRGALLEADAAAGKLTVTSTNLEAALEEKLPCTVQEAAAGYRAALPGRKSGTHDAQKRRRLL